MGLFFLFTSVFLGLFRNLRKLGCNIRIPVFAMRNETVRAVLYSILYVNKVSAALIAQSIKRTIAKQAIKIFAFRFVAREIFTFGIFKITIIIFHNINSSETMQLYKLIITYNSINNNPFATTEYTFGIWIEKIVCKRKIILSHTLYNH